jgi:dihydroxyacetone kinase-like protein
MTMKKFINKPENLVQELLEGFTLAYPAKVKLAGSNLVVRSKPKEAGKVGIVTLGGSGHEPGLSGFVGMGMLDISVPGEIFAAPGVPRVLESVKLAERGAGVLMVVLNHPGDVLSAGVVMDFAKKQNLNLRMVLTHEDIASSPKESMDERRGLVGFVPVYKVAGAAAEAGQSLDAIVAIAERMSQNMRVLSVAARTATHPSTGMELSPLGEDEMEIGAGQHGETGSGRMKLLSADETANIMLQRLLDDLEAKSGDELLVIVNGMGATTLMELFLVFRRMKQVLDGKKIKIVRSLVGEYITAQEQAGFQMFIARMDAELLQLWDAPCDTPYHVVR